ncbi:MAG: hypothetical protein ABGZ23_28825 [Fuerstiella sp.]
MAKTDANFWGEYQRCRVRTVNTRSGGRDTTADQADRQYHGGMGHRAEW